jgi:hypothetical protein
MSIVESLLKIVDPVQAKAREEERRVQREQPVRNDDADPPRFACRVCGTEDDQGSYCPKCLAGTMRRMPRARKTDAPSE